MLSASRCARFKRSLANPEVFQSDAEELTRTAGNQLDLWSDDIREKTLRKRSARMEKLSLGSPELGVIRTYVEWITRPSLEYRARRTISILDPCAQDTRRGSLSGWRKVKDRIIEYLAVLTRKPGPARPGALLRRPAWNG